MHASRLRGIVAIIFVLTALEIALVGKVDPQETPFGAGIAVLAAGAALAAGRTAGVAYRVHLRWLFYALVVVRNVVRDTAVVSGAIFARFVGREPRDRVIEIPFAPGPNAPGAAARRALVVAAMSTSPNEIVLAIDGGRSVLRAHVLVPTRSARASRAWPL